MAKKYDTTEPVFEIRQDGSEVFLSFVADTGRIRKVLHVKKVPKDETSVKKLIPENLEKRLELIERKISAIEEYLLLNIQIEDPSSVEIFEDKPITTDYCIESNYQ